MLILDTFLALVLSTSPHPRLGLIVPLINPSTLNAVEGNLVSANLLNSVRESPHLGELQRALLRRRSVLTDFLLLAVRPLTENVVTEVKEGLEGGLSLLHLYVIDLFDYAN